MTTLRITEKSTSSEQIRTVLEDTISFKLNVSDVYISKGQKAEV